MDQTVCCLAKEGRCLLVSPDSEVQEVALPSGVAIVIASSLVTAQKAVGAKISFNSRVIEGRLGCVLLWSILRSTLPSDGASSFEPPLTLGQLQALAGGREGLHRLVFAVRSELHEEPYSLQEIEQVVTAHMGQPFDAASYLLRYSSSSSSSVHEVLQHYPLFKLQQMCLHTIQEAERYCSSFAFKINSILGFIVNRVKGSCLQRCLLW